MPPPPHHHPSPKGTQQPLVGMAPFGAPSPGPPCPQQFGTHCLISGALHDQATASTCGGPTLANPLPQAQTPAGRRCGGGWSAVRLGGQTTPNVHRAGRYLQFWVSVVPFCWHRPVSTAHSQHIAMLGAGIPNFFLTGMHHGPPPSELSSSLKSPCY